IGVAPFVFVYLWFENLRAISSVNFTQAMTFVGYAKTLFHVPVGIILDGLYGQLLSPGRSFFLYSPLLILIFLFTYKIKKHLYSELVLWITLSLIFVLFYAAQYSSSTAPPIYTEFWHGELSWGPRYLTPLIPFGMLLVGSMYEKLHRNVRLLVFLP